MSVRGGQFLKAAAATAVLLIGSSFAGCWCVLPSGDVPTGGYCTRDRECIPGDICYNGVCVGEGVLRVSLSWTVTSDFDLHLLLPSGTEIYYGNSSSEGGTLDLDDCVGGSCADPGAVHVENIYFDVSAPGGTYQVWIENYDGLAAGSYTIDVSTGDVFTGSLGAVSGESSPLFTFVY